MKLRKKDYGSHGIEELVNHLSIFGRPAITRIRNPDCQITYSASVNRVGLMNLWATLKSDEGPTARVAIRNTLSVIERELWMVCEDN
jgi:hypothetical protein